MKDCVNIAIFASGSGTNAQNLIEHFNLNRTQDHTQNYQSNGYNANPLIKIKLILSNNPEAFVLKRAEKLGVPSHIFTPEQLKRTDIVDNILSRYSIDYIILAGFLLKIPDRIVDKYENKIINIHPSLLPKFGGKGMYGKRVHQAVIESGEKESGITIHLVDKEYDNGAHLLQVKCSISPEETPDTLAEKIHQLEWKHFPEAVKSYISKVY